MIYSTANLCDIYSNTEHFQIGENLLKIYGGKQSFSGLITTVKTYEDNSLIRTIVEEKVENRVLVVDGGGSQHCALIDKNIAKLAITNGWQGIIVNGCIRDSSTINKLPIGVRALNTHPLKSHKKDHGDRDLPISFTGLNFKKDHFLFADSDGIVVSANILR
jgi:regulator of ribonuclease activity A